MILCNPEEEGNNDIPLCTFKKVGAAEERVAKSLNSFAVEELKVALICRSKGGHSIYAPLRLELLLKIGS